MTKEEGIKKAGGVIREPKINYKGSFTFLASYLVFSEDGLPVDRETRGFFQRRINHQHTPVQIAISVLIYALHQCYGSLASYALWKDFRHEGKTFDYIEGFWPSSGSRPENVLKPYTAHEMPELFGCYILDWRGLLCLPARQEVDSYKALTSFFGVIVVLSDCNLHISAFHTQPAPFGMASFLTKQEWDKFCESLL